MGRMKMTTIGLVMIVRNESRSLEKCLSLAEKLVDESTLQTPAQLTIQ